MQIILNYIKNNKKKIIILIILIILVLILSIPSINKQDKRKIYASDSYVYTKETYKDVYTSKLPTINIKGNDVLKVNNELIKQYYEIKALNKEIMDYEYFLSENILSLIVKVYDKEVMDKFPSSISIYNINIDNGILLTDKQLLEKFLVSSNEAKTVLKKRILEYYNYEIKKGYIDSSCNFDCYLENINSLNILDNCQYYIKDNYLMVYKYLMIDSDFAYDVESDFDLYNFVIKKY